MNVNAIMNTIYNYTDNDLLILAKQVLKLFGTGVSDEYPLRELIDNYPMGAVMGTIAVPQYIMQECTNRWIAKIESEKK